jgi:hypothetical protein
LHALRPEDSPDVDFMALVKDDKSFPDAKTWGELRGYLQQYGDAAVVAGRAVWRRYLNAQRRASTNA